MTKGRRTIEGVIYGPVNSRRFGRSLGINLISTGKYCSFNCVYCFRGFNEGSLDKNKADFYTRELVVEAFNEYVNNNSLKDVDDISVAGNGEPTDSKFLPEIIDYLYDFRNKNYPDIKLTILTNGMGFISRLNPDSGYLMQSITKLDQVCVKLDSGNADTWRKIGNPYKKTEFSEWFAAIKNITKPSVQTMLLNGRIDNTTEDELNLLINSYKELNPERIHVITINKTPADSRLKPVPEDKLNEINKRIQKEVYES